MKSPLIKTKHLLYLSIVALIFSSCAESVNVEILSETEPYGFWNGLWHGIISPVSIVISLFKEEVAMYAINNNGAWYNFGFLFGASIIFGGGCKAGGNKKAKKCCE